MGQIKNGQSRDTGQYWVQFTEERSAKQKNTTQKNKKMSNTPSINRGCTKVFAKGDSSCLVSNRPVVKEINYKFVHATI